MPVVEHQTQTLKTRAAALLNRAAHSKVALIATIAVVVLAVSGATFGYRSMTTPVTLSVDGQEREVRVLGDTVGDVLDAEGIELTAHDVVQPDVDEAISDGTRIAVRFGREVELTVDGKTTTPLGDRDRRRRRAEPDRRALPRRPSCRPAVAPRSTVAASSSRSSPRRP